MMLADGVATPISLEAASCGVRASQLWSTPMQLSLLLAAAQTLGIDPLNERELMWIAHLSLCLSLPAGWVEHPTAGADETSRRRRRAESRLPQRDASGAPAKEPKLPKVFISTACWASPRRNGSRRSSPTAAGCSTRSYATPPPPTPPPPTQRQQAAEGGRARRLHESTPPAGTRAGPPATTPTSPPPCPRRSNRTSRTVGTRRRRSANGCTSWRAAGTSSRT